MKKFRGSVVLLILLVGKLAVAADLLDTTRLPRESEKGSPFALVYDASVGVRLNPLGLFLTAALLARYRLYENSAAALSDNYVGLEPILFLSPAATRIGGALVVQPLSVLQLSAGYELVEFFGAFNSLQSYPTATADTSDTVLAELAKEKLNYRSHGGTLDLGATARVKAGPIAILSAFKAFHYDLRLRAGDRVWYDPVLDVMSSAEGWTVTDDTDVVFVSSFRLVAGLRYTFTDSFFSARDYLPGQAQVNPNSPIQRVGPLVAYTFFNRPNAHFNSPTLLVIAQWFLQHRYRTGAEISEAIPWLVVAFTFNGQIW